MGTATYVPLTRAVQISSSRVSNALVALSIAEIRPSLTPKQVMDTVDELRSAVDEAVVMHQLFLSQLDIHDQDTRASKETIRDLTRRRSEALAKSDARTYKTVNAELLDQVNRARFRVPPTMAACTLVASDAPFVPPPVQLSQADPGSDPESIIKKRYKQRKIKT